MQTNDERAKARIDAEVLTFFELGVKRFGPIAIANAAGTIKYQSVRNVIERGSGHRETILDIQRGLEILCKKDDEFKEQMRRSALKIAGVTTERQEV